MPSRDHKSGSITESKPPLPGIAIRFSSPDASVCTTRSGSGPEDVPLDRFSRKMASSFPSELTARQLTAWLPEGPVTVGLTAGASTPNNVVGEVIERVLALRGRRADELVGAP